MACRYDDGDDIPVKYGECLRELDKLTQLLCEAMQVIDSDIDPKPGRLSPDLVRWWKKHKEEDAKRAKLEEENRLSEIKKIEADIRAKSETLAAAKSRLEALKKRK